MTFGRLAEEFSEIVQRYSGSKRDRRMLMHDVRVACADGGLELLRTVQEKKLPRPESAAFWLQGELERSSSEEYRGFESSIYPSWTLGSLANWDGLVANLAISLSSWEGDAEPAVSKLDARSVAYRHVFYEAALGWLSKLQGVRGATISFPTASVIAADGEGLEVVFDGVRWDQGQPSIHWVLPFVRRARECCEWLDGSLTAETSKAPSGAERDRRSADQQAEGSGPKTPPSTLGDASDWLVTKNVLLPYLRLDGRHWLRRIDDHLGNPEWAAPRCRSLYRLGTMIKVIEKLAPQGTFDSDPPRARAFGKRLARSAHPPDFEPEWKHKATAMPADVVG